MTTKRTILTALIAVIIPLTACAQKYHHDDGHDTTPTDRISFKVENGQLQAIGPDGQRLKLEPVTFPVNSKQILSVDQITIIKVKGSHFIMGCFLGGCGRYDLPPPHPPQ